MSAYHEILDAIRGADTYHEKIQLAEYLAQALQQGKRPDAADAKILADFAMSEIRALPSIIEATERTRERDAVCQYGNVMPAFLMAAYKSPNDLSEADQASIRTLVEAIRREQFMEMAMAEMFDEGIPAAADLDRLLFMVAPLKDEYRKGSFFSGLLNYRDRVSKLSSEAKGILARYTASELRRCLSMEAFDEEVQITLEVMVDACSLYLTDELADLITEVMARCNHATMYFAASTLLAAGKPVPDAVIDTLARDLVHADGLYQDLCRAGQAARFPAELANDEYLAKSDMIHWLTYPTELGKVPDEIEYLGRVKKGLLKGEVFHVFRFKSDSDTLGDECKDKWLIGWSGEEDGTFSNFDLYDEYAGATPEQTLKNIKRKLL